MINDGDYIDVFCEETVEDNDSENEEKDKKVDITVNTDPVSAIVDGVFKTINNITNSAKEYSICKQQEKTKREAIKAQMKVDIEKINAQKEYYLEVLNKQYEMKMYQIKSFYEQYSEALSVASDAVHVAIDVAKESKNFSDVCSLLEIERNILKDTSEAELRFMELSQNVNNYYIGNNPVKGLIE